MPASSLQCDTCMNDVDNILCPTHHNLVFHPFTASFFLGHTFDQEYMIALPEELILMILNMLSPLDLVIFLSVAKKIRKIVEQTQQYDFKVRFFKIFQATDIVFAPNWLDVFIKILYKKVNCLQCFRTTLENVSQLNINGIARKRFRNDLLKRGAGDLFVDGVHWGLVSENVGIAVIKGPEDSPFIGKLFYLVILIHDIYPFSAPTIRFLTPIFHPNIDKWGNIRYGVLTNSHWKHTYSIFGVLIGLRNLLTYPNIDNSCNFEATMLYTYNPLQYFREAESLARKC